MALVQIVAIIRRDALEAVKGILLTLEPSM